MATLPAAGQGELLFIGTATTLLRYGGLTLLTDPNFLRRGQRAYLGYGLTTRRLTEPAMRLDELPELDAVVLSHLHGDHFDRVASRGLDRDLAILTTPAGARRLQLRRFSRAVGLRTWTGQTLHRDGRTLRVTALPGMHAKGALRALLPPVMGTLLDFLDAAGRVEYRIYVSGDTLMFDGVHTIAERYPDIDLLVVHLGGTTLPGGRVVTMDGEQGVRFLRAVAPRRVAPVHYDDYDRFRSPLEDFQRRAEAAGLEGICSYLRRGETLALTPRRQQVPEA